MDQRITSERARFMRKVQVSQGDGCWPWLGCIDKGGYGYVKYTDPNTGRRVGTTAHHRAYELFVGPVPRGLDVEHVCERRDCVRWTGKHLKPATRAKNISRSSRHPAAVNARKTHCIRGHRFSRTNTYRYTSRWGRPKRACRTCFAITRAAWLERRRSRIS